MDSRRTDHWKRWAGRYWNRNGRLAFRNKMKGIGLSEKSLDLEHRKVVPNEQRKHQRLQLRLPVKFSSTEESSEISCVTENISSDGFYCICPQLFLPGQRLEVQLLVPTHGYEGVEPSAYITCQVQVVRVDSLGPGPGFGVACRIENYSVALEKI